MPRNVPEGRQARFLDRADNVRRWAGPADRLDAELGGLDRSVVSALLVPLIPEAVPGDEALDYARVLAELGMVDAADAVVDAIVGACRAAGLLGGKALLLA